MEAIRVRWTKNARKALDTIYEYHAANSQQGADRLMRHIYNAADRLAVFPMSGQIELYIQYTVPPYRSVVVDKRYKLIYTVEDDGALVIIHNVWPCKRDPRYMSSFTLKRKRTDTQQ